MREKEGDLEARLRELLLVRRDGPPSPQVARALVRMVEKTLRVYQEVLAVAIAGLPCPSEAEIEEMEAGRAPISKAAYQVGEIWQACLRLEDAEECLAEFRRPPIARKDTLVLLRAALLDVKNHRWPGPSSELQRFVKRLLKAKA